MYTLQVGRITLSIQRITLSVVHFTLSVVSVGGTHYYSGWVQCITDRSVVKIYSVGCTHYSDHSPFLGKSLKRLDKKLNDNNTRYVDRQRWVPSIATSLTRKRSIPNTWDLQERGNTRLVSVKTMEPSIKPNNEGTLDPVETGSSWMISNTTSRRDSLARVLSSNSSRSGK